MIESYSAKPETVRGSVTITNGVKIEAVAKYVHQFSNFGHDPYEQPLTYFFAYQVRISGPPAIKQNEENTT